jgi:transcriptional regulator with XRE-family HTH domain
MREVQTGLAQCLRIMQTHAMSKLREARVARNLTLQDVAKAVETDPGNLSRIERGQAASKALARRLFEFYDGQVPLSAIHDPEFESGRP